MELERLLYKANAEVFLKTFQLTINSVSGKLNDLGIIILVLTFTGLKHKCIQTNAMLEKTNTQVIDDDYFIDISDDGEIDFWMVTLGLSAKTLIKAVGLVGPDAREVRKWMKKNNPKKKPPLRKRIYSFIARTLTFKRGHSVPTHK